DHVIAGLNFPFFPRFCGQMFAHLGDRDLGLTCVRAYNDFVIDEWCAAAPGRYIPMVIIPLWDTRLAVEETLRCAGKGAKAIAFSENLHPLGFPSIHSGAWDDFFAAVNETKMPLCTHIGSSSVSPTTSPDAPFGVQAVTEMGEHLTTEPGEERKVQSRDHMILVHVGDAGHRVEVCARHIIVIHWQRRILGRPLVSRDQDAQHRRARLLVNPRIDAVDALDVWHPVAVGGRCAVDP
ncbi:amidohydrolase family protein, partial [Mycobacterium colombiense]|uniref:amidohydrolase family protein n=1 Tax=Mycobacterium colombiense TaxID=339268 RepID=UPI000A70933F